MSDDGGDGEPPVDPPVDHPEGGEDEGGGAPAEGDESVDAGDESVDAGGASLTQEPGGDDGTAAAGGEQEGGDGEMEGDDDDVLEDEGDDRFDDDFEGARGYNDGGIGDEGDQEYQEQGGNMFNGNNYQPEVEEEDATLDPNNPLYARIRAALSKQLEEQQSRIREDLREKDEDLKRLKKKKEDVGVELYGVQQQLARMQLILEKTHDNFNMVRKLREQAEEETRSVFNEYEKKKVEVAAQQKRMNTFQAELDKLNSTLHQVEQYNEQMKGEIAITRRATYKTEEHVQGLEMDKKQQDMLIDDLMRSTKKLEEKLSIYESQLAAQKEETRQAKQVLQEAALEMEKIRLEKKQLLHQWKSSLLAVQRRDEHLQSVDKALREVQQQELALLGEISSLKMSVRKEQDRNESVSGLLSKVRNSAAFLERQLEQVRGQKQRVQEQFSVLKRSLEQSDAELASVEQEKTQVIDQTAKMDKLLISTQNETHKMEEAVLQSLAEQTTLQKAAQSTDKATQMMQQQMHGKENELAQVRNEMSRIKVDSLNTLAHNDQLKATVKDIDEELKRKEQLVAKYEVEIRRRNDEIEKKMRDLDTLNRKFEGLRAKLEAAAGDAAAAAGPLEATIKSLRTEIDAKRKACNDLQRMWMSTQTELVKLSNEASAQSERVGEVKAQTAVLTQKRVRVDAQIGIQKKEIDELQKSMSSMHTDMAKLNELIGQNHKNLAALEGDNFTLEADLTNTLKDLEEAAVRLESTVRSTLEQKERVKLELVEKEREIMVLERKMELEKETQAAYTQKDDAGDVMQGMKKEIHRMHLRYAQLMRRQEELMVEMERAIFKRDAIGIRGKMKQAQSKQGTGAGTKGDLKRMVQELAKRVQDLEGEIGRHDTDIKQLDGQQKELGVRMDEAGAAIREVQHEDDQILRQMYLMDKEKQNIKVEVYALQKMKKRYEGLERGQYQARPPAELAEGLARAEERAAVLRQVAGRLSGLDQRIADSLAPLIH